MAVNVTGRKPMFGNRRSHALNATRHKQKLNLQVVTLEDGTKIRMTAREKRTLLKDSTPIDVVSTEEVVETPVVEEVVEEEKEEETKEEAE